MGIYIDSVTFDNGVATTPFYQANTGDKIIANMVVRGRIRMTSVSNPLTLDPTTNIVTSPSISWLEEGFRVGDWVLARISTSGGATITEFWTQVVSVGDIECDFGPMPAFYDFSAGQIMQFFVVAGNGITTAVARDEVDVLFNHVKNSDAGTPNSLIDGEMTRVRFSGVAGLAIGGTINGVVLGNKSGSMFVSGVLERITQIDAEFRYEFRLEFVNTGMFDDGTWFFTGECLKAYFKTEWGRLSGESFGRKVVTYSLSANTGYYNEPFNAGTLDSTLVQGVSEIEYCTPTSHTVIVDGATSGVQIGACYLSTDDTYFKNKYQSQLDLSMVIPSTDAVVGTLSSALNPSGAGYDIEITNVQVIGSQTIIDFDFIPNPQFDAFMEGRDSLDRLMLVWVKCGSVNHLVYSKQLECNPAPAGPLVMVSNVAYLDHSRNVEVFSPNIIDDVFNTEDDFAFYGTFVLDKGVVYDNLNIYVEAVNNVTGEDFSLRAIQFNFSGVLVSGDGRYLLNEAVTVNAQLPTTSKKIQAKLILEPSLDSPTQYGVSVYAPFILDWKYWLPLAGVSTDFYPNLNKNWQQYQTTDWAVQFRLELVKEGLGYNHTEPIQILDYDSEANIVQNIELYIDDTGVNVDIVTEGQLMRVVATHTLLGGLVWDVPFTWGMITVEPFEQQPRSICSTRVPYDFDPNNPLYPLSGVLMPITYPAPNVARMECYFNPDLINTTNGVKFTTKIKQNDNPQSAGQKTTAPDDLPKTTDLGDNKTLAP